MAKSSSLPSEVTAMAEEIARGIGQETGVGDNDEEVYVLQGAIFVVPV